MISTSQTSICRCAVKILQQPSATHVFKIVKLDFGLHVGDFCKQSSIPDRFEMSTPKFSNLCKFWCNVWKSTWSSCRLSCSTNAKRIPAHVHQSSVHADLHHTYTQAGLLTNLKSQVPTNTVSTCYYTSPSHAKHTHTHTKTVWPARHHQLLTSSLHPLKLSNTSSSGPCKWDSTDLVFTSPYPSGHCESGSAHHRNYRIPPPDIKSTFPSGHYIQER